MTDSVGFGHTIAAMPTAIEITPTTASTHHEILIGGSSEVRTTATSMVSLMIAKILRPSRDFLWRRPISHAVR